MALAASLGIPARTGFKSPGAILAPSWPHHGPIASRSLLERVSNAAQNCDPQQKESRGAQFCVGNRDQHLGGRHSDCWAATISLIRRLQIRICGLGHFFLTWVGADPGQTNLARPYPTLRAVCLDWIQTFGLKSVVLTWFNLISPAQHYFVSVTGCGIAQYTVLSLKFYQCAQIYLKYSQPPNWTHRARHTKRCTRN